MQTNLPKLEKACMDHLVDCLNNAEHLDIRKPLPPHRGEGEAFPMDGWVQIHTKNETIWIALDVKKIANPREIRIEIEYLKRLGMHFGANFYGVIGSEYISPSVRKLCAENGVGYVDLEGNCRLSFLNVYIDKEIIHSKKEAKKQLKSLFGAKASRILRRLLLDSPKLWDVKTMALEANASASMTSLVKTKLLNEEFAIQKDGQFTLKNPEQLLLEWSKYYSGSGESHEFYYRGALEELESRIAQVCSDLFIDYGFTSFSGAKRVASFTRGIQKSYMYIESDFAMELLVESVGLKEVASAGSLKIIVPSDIDTLFKKQLVEGVFVVNDIQLYLDLVHQGGRAIDNAEFLLESRIKQKW